MTVGTVTGNLGLRVWDGVDGTNDNDILIETDNVERFDTFLLSSSQGSMDVEVHNGQDWLTSPLSLGDLGAVSNTPVLATAQLRQYGFRGSFEKIRIRQNGATAVLNPVLRCIRLA